MFCCFAAVVVVGSGGGVAVAMSHLVKQRCLWFAVYGYK